MNPHAQDLFDKIADKLVQELAAGQKIGAGWKAPWVRSAELGGPISIKGRPYRGGNAFWLSFYTVLSPSQVWGTYKALKAAGHQVRKGEKGTQVALWKRSLIDEKDASGAKTGEKKQILWCKIYTVFALEQTDCADPQAVAAKLRKTQELPQNVEPCAYATSMLNAFYEGENIAVQHGGNQACYIPGWDRIHLPPVAAFTSTEGYYGTAIHEAVHATGHKTRLDRDFSGRFGSEAYAFEELIAEIGAAFLTIATGVTSTLREDHVQYLASWAKILQEEKGKAILTATSKAQQAADFLLQYAPGAAAEDDEDETFEEAA